MRVDVLCFGVLKDLVGERRSLTLADGACVRDVLGAVRDGSRVWETVAVAVNREYAGLGTVLRDGDEVAILPPVSGGAVESHVSEARRGAPGVGVRGGTNAG